MRAYQLTFFDHEGSRVTRQERFEDTPGIPAEQWAEDWAYTVADKREHTLTEITDGD